MNRKSPHSPLEVEADAVFTFLSDFCLVLYSLELCGLLFVPRSAAV